MTEIQRKLTLVRVSEGSNYRESTILELLVIVKQQRIDRLSQFCEVLSFFPTVKSNLCLVGQGDRVVP